MLLVEAVEEEEADDDDDDDDDGAARVSLSMALRGGLGVRGRLGCSPLCSLPSSQLTRRCGRSSRENCNVAVNDSKFLLKKKKTTVTFYEWSKWYFGRLENKSIGVSVL